MLVVVGMIASLAAISFPVYRGVQKKVENQQFVMMINSIERSVDDFETEYNYLPYVGSAYPNADNQYYWLSDHNAIFLGILMGLENSCNFKKIKFLELKDAKGTGPAAAPGPAGYTDGVVIDGTKATLYNGLGMHYVYRLDHDLNGEIADARIPGFPTNAQMVSGYKILIHTCGSTTWSKPDFVVSFDLP